MSKNSDAIVIGVGAVIISIGIFLANAWLVMFAWNLGVAPVLILPKMHYLTSICLMIMSSALFNRANISKKD